MKHMGTSRRAFLLLALLGSVLGCMSVQDRSHIEQVVRADAEARSASYCSRQPEGCEISVQKSRGGWSALITPIHTGKDGRRYVGIDTDDFYMYRSNGNFESSLRGYK